MIPITGKPNTLAPNATYPFGNILDDDGTGDGTPVNQEVYADFHQFFSKLMSDAGISPNGQPENAYNTFQLNLALAAFINAKVAAAPAFIGLALINSFTGGPTAPKYRIDPTGKITIMVQGITVPTGSGPGSVKDFATLPAAIIPANTKFATCYDVSTNLPLTNNSIAVSSGGTLQLWGSFILGSGTIYRAYEISYWKDS